MPEEQPSARTSPQPSEQPPNNAPTITGTPSTSATAGTLWQFQFVVNDADGDALTISADGLPTWAILDPQARVIAGIPTAAHVGANGPIVIRVSDGEATASLAPFVITVAQALAVPPPDPEPEPEPNPAPMPPPPLVNTAPTISGVPATTVQATQPYSFVPVASDDQTPQSLSFSITNKPAWATFNTTTGALTGTPSASQTGTYGNIRITVSDGSLSASLPAFSITVTPAPNRPPVISGAPSTTSITAGTAWSFRPTASDPDGQPLSFSITNKPVWATFSTITGTLSGTPTDQHAGTTSNIVITATDTTGASASLQPFSLTVTAMPRNGSAELSWSAPTQYEDGSALSPQEIAAYRIYYGTSRGDLDRLAEVDSGTRMFTVTGLAAGTHYFAVTTVTVTGMESDLSAVGSKTIP